MKDPLESSRRMIAQARKHILDLDKQIKIFNEAVPETVTAEADPQIEHKQPYHIKFAKVVPSSLAETVSDIAGNLRAALDQAGYAVAVASGKAVPKYCAFPFAGSATEFENALNGRAKDLPQQIRALLRAFKPYRGGNDLLWALNEICVSNEHRMLVPVLMFSTGFMITARIPPDSTVEIPMIGPTWDSATNEVIIARQGPDINFDYDINFYISVALDGIEVIRGKPVLGVLDKLLGEVESILLSIEAEAKRLGLFR